MKEIGIGEYRSINAFVEAKLETYSKMERNFSSLFELMFREKENIMYEKSEGYKILKTTYGEVYNNILKKAAYLKSITKDFLNNDVIGIYMENSLEWIEAFWAVLVCGFRPLLMNLRLSDKFLQQAIDECKVKAVISSEKQFGVKMISELTPSDEEYIPVNFGSEIMVMSSGTSEAVKICAYSAEELYYQICDSYNIIKECKLLKSHFEGGLKLLTFLPFYHIFGFTALYMWFAFFSRTFVQLNNLLPETVLNTIKRHKVTHVFAVPLFWEKIYDGAQKAIKNRGEKTFAKFEKALKISNKIGDVPILGKLFTKFAFKEVRENLFGESIRFMITGGSSISVEVLSFFNAIGYRLANGYGMSEVGITSVELSDKRAYLNSAYVGKPLSHVEYKISDKGELLIRGKTLAKYVIENGKVRYNNGWFETHDLSECQNGHYKILGRKDDVVITANGENINPNLLEPSLNIPEVNGVCIIGSEENSEKIAVLLVSVNKFMPKQHFMEIDSKIKDKIKAFNMTSQIGKIVYISNPIQGADEFKINRMRIARDYNEGRFSLVEPMSISANEADDNELMGKIKKLFAVALEKNAEDIGVNSDFFLDEGGTSLDYYAMIAKMQEEFSVSFPENLSECPNTAGEMYEYVRTAINYDD